MDPEELAAIATKLMLTRGERVSRSACANPGTWRTAITLRRRHVKSLRDTVRKGDFKGALLLFGNDSDAGFLFLEAALPLIPVQDRARIIRDAWSYGVFGEHARGNARRLRGGTLASRTANLFRQVPELKPTTLADSVQIYRGVYARNEDLALLCGMSPAWTSRRDIAAWFALRYGNRDSSWILETVVTRDNVLAVIDERSEAEVVVDTSQIAFRNIRAVRPTSQDCEAVARIDERRRQEHAARLASIHARQERGTE